MNALSSFYHECLNGLTLLHYIFTEKHQKLHKQSHFAVILLILLPQIPKDFVLCFQSNFVGIKFFNF